MSRISLLTLFPELVEAHLGTSILKRAQEKKILELAALNLRNFCDPNDHYKAADDTPFGGGEGMLFRSEVLDRALDHVLVDRCQGERGRLKVLYPSPRGLELSHGVLTQFRDWFLAEPAREIVIVAGRYEGIDERIVNRWVDLEFSVGDFVLTGGELPGLMFADALVRLVPGVLGNAQSAQNESFTQGLLESAQYTKPRDFRGQGVPSELVSGHHQKIQDYKLRESLMMSFAFRPDLIRSHTGEGLPNWGQELLDRLKARIDLRT
jgi:tRNA (guanine37-N1)-methyltransferase